MQADGASLVAYLAPASELSIALVDDAEIQLLNRDYRAKDQPTDVLAFPMDGSEGLLGDVVISLETAIRQAREHGVTPACEVRTLLVHGFLHLLGYDHERSAKDARSMFRKQRAMIKRLEKQQP